MHLNSPQKPKHLPCLSCSFLSGASSATDFSPSDKPSCSASMNERPLLCFTTRGRDEGSVLAVTLKVLRLLPFLIVFFFFFFPRPPLQDRFQSSALPVFSMPPIVILSSIPFGPSPPRRILSPCAPHFVCPARYPHASRVCPTFCNPRSPFAAHRPVSSIIDPRRSLWWQPFSLGRPGSIGCLFHNGPGSRLNRVPSACAPSAVVSRLCARHQDDGPLRRPLEIGTCSWACMRDLLNLAL